LEVLGKWIAGGGAGNRKTSQSRSSGYGL